jgi:hypothetical protein
MILAYLRGMRIPTDISNARSGAAVRARVVQPGYPDQECEVMDISQNGAKIVVETGSMISTRFELAFGADSRRACDLVWRLGNTLGVRFFAWT